MAAVKEFIRLDGSIEWARISKQLNRPYLSVIHRYNYHLKPTVPLKKGKFSKEEVICYVTYIIYVFGCYLFFRMTDY